MLVAQLPVWRRGRRRRLIDYGRGVCLRGCRGSCGSRRVGRRGRRRSAHAPPPPRPIRVILALALAPTLVSVLSPRRTVPVALPAAVAGGQPRARRRVCRRVIAAAPRWCCCRGCCWFLPLTIVLVRLHLAYTMQRARYAELCGRCVRQEAAERRSRRIPNSRSTAQRWSIRSLGTTPALVFLTCWGRRDAFGGPSRAQLPGGWRLGRRWSAVRGAQGVQRAHSIEHRRHENTNRSMLTKYVGAGGIS